TDIDLIISNDPTRVWFFDTTGTLPVPFGQTDLYHVVLHELGHGVGHAHIIDSTKIMHYSLPQVPSGGLAANKRYVALSTDASAVDGGVDQIITSSSVS